MNETEWVKGLFEKFDRRDVDAFASYLTDDVVFRIGNAPLTEGKKTVTVTVQAFFDMLDAIRHEISNVWAINNTVICNGFVTYTRQNGSMLEVPFANVMKRDGDYITEYLIYVDVSELFF